MEAIVFAGTTEGRAVIKALLGRKIRTTACIATDYGKEILEYEDSGSEDLILNTGRLTPEQMKALIASKTGLNLVIDATHPYAVDVTANIKKACKETGTIYIRIHRKSTLSDDSGNNIPEAAVSLRHKDARIELAENVDDVISWANKEENLLKKILLTTGSKDLRSYTGIINYKERVYPRLLPDMDSLRNASELGYKKANIICMQGPFSTDMNQALIEATGAQALVTKDTGKTGGFNQKLEAAEIMGIVMLIIKRPPDEASGPAEKPSMSAAEFETFLENWELQNLSGTGSEKAQAQAITAQAQSAVSTNENDVETDDQSKSGPGIYPKFPLFIDLKGKKVTIIGAGKIAQRRIETWLTYGADIRVIAPEQTERIRELAQGGRLRIIARTYCSGDLKGSVLAVTATDSRDINHQVYEEAKKLAVPISVADEKNECSFYFPAVMQKGNISIGLVSDGSDHAGTARTAAKLRTCLDIK